jgi:exopolysaccharide biosynthesis polyprenyl glycosylphosphotransferase
VLGDEHELEELVELLDAERVIVAFSSMSHEESLDRIRTLNSLKVQVDVVPRFFDVIPAGGGAHTVEGLPLFSLPPGNLSPSSRVLKRAVDLGVSVLALVLLAPLFLAAAIAIKRDSRGPVFFRQRRMGEGGRPFMIWKFRSMTMDADERKQEFAHLNKHLAPGGDPRMFKIDDDPRETRVGRWLRKTSFDELPQLFNVVSGQMSLVGPRPLIPEETRYVDEWAARRLDLRPGMTGLWQVLGRDGIGFGEMVRIDYRYVTNWSIGTDLSLIFRTIPALLRPSRGR